MAPAAMSSSVREKFARQGARIKSILRPPFLLLVLLYPAVIFSTFEACVAYPGSSGKMAFDAAVFLRTCASFALHSLVHVSLLRHIVVQAPSGATPLARSSPWFVPMAFWWSSFMYFFTYASVARYGTHISDWIAVGVASAWTLAVTLLHVSTPVKVANVVIDEAR